VAEWSGCSDEFDFPEQGRRLFERETAQQEGALFERFAGKRRRDAVEERRHVLRVSMACSQASAF
jgi:hypothetical protein